MTDKVFIAMHALCIMLSNRFLALHANCLQVVVRVLSLTWELLFTAQYCRWDL